MLEKYFKMLGGKQQDTVPATGAVVDPVPPPAPSPPVRNEGVIDTDSAPPANVVANVLTVDTHGAPVDMAKLSQRFIIREPVLDRSHNLIGYEFRLRDRDARAPDPALAKLHDEMLIRAVLGVDLDRLLGSKLAFVPLSAAVIEDPIVERLPALGVVLAVKISAEDAPRLLPRLKQLIAAGYSLALDDLEYSGALEPVLKIVRYAAIDITRFDALELRKQAAAVLKKASPALVAKRVESDEDIEACRNLSFSLFQGYYFARMRPKQLPKMDNNRATVMQLLNMVRDRGEISALEQVFKRDAALSYNLLRYINSPGCGMLQTIRSIAHALIILGYEQLYRWLTLLLFSAGKPEPQLKALLKNALVRARLSEIVGQNKLLPKDQEGLFIVGIFSLLDVLLNMPMNQALGNLSLPPPVVDALLHRAGIYAPFLELAIACEEDDQEKVARCAAALGLTAEALNAAHVQALTWAEDVDK